MQIICKNTYDQYCRHSQKNYDLSDRFLFYIIFYGKKPQFPNISLSGKWTFVAGICIINEKKEYIEGSMYSETKNEMEMFYAGSGITAGDLRGK